ncbi:phosphotransferase [Candidatus Pelagibacter sp.]|nr:phosphotransferase [Candidatus Pelagibacter sp.]
MLIYDAINSLLIKNKVLAPKLYSENYKKNYIEIEDFGDNSVFYLLKKNKNQQETLYKKSIDLLGVIQKIKQNRSKNFNGKTYKIPIYDNVILFNEANLFYKWYAKKFVKKNKLTKFKIDIKKQIKFLLTHLQSKEKVFVHRDFHVSNLMKFKNKIGVIDSQDALIGNRAYDLASLIDDVRFKTDKTFKDKIYRYYLKLNKKRVNEATLLRDFEILSILRNMKIIGIFTRLAMRDKKKQYLKLIPYAWKLIELRISNNKKFSELKSLLDLNFSKKIRNQK